MKNPFRFFLSACIVSLLAVMAGCAVQHVPATLEPALGADMRQRVVAAQVQVGLPTGYTRALRAGSVWRFAGKLPQGDVYRPVGDVFTLEGAHIHEAYLVVKDGSLVGFYLPAERAFSPLDKALSIPFQ